jgi:von Willebrand factor type A domain
MSSEKPTIKKEEPIAPASESGHGRAIDLFEANRDLFQGYAGGAIKVEPARADLNTFAFNLETNTIYLNSKFYEQLGYPEAGTSFATLHEIEHFLEKIAMLSEEGGAAKFKSYLDTLDDIKGNLKYRGKAYGLMDNCMADVRQNAAVVSKAPVYKDTEQSLYRDVQFPDVDFVTQNIPKHIQLSYAILNEMRTGRKCEVSPEVREHIDALEAMKTRAGKSVLEVMTDKKLPMSRRLEIMDTHVWPRVQELLEQDIKEKNEGKDEKDGDNESNTRDDSESGEDEGASQSPDEMFADDYAESDKRVPNAVPVEEQKKELEKWTKENRDPKEKALKDRAEQIGVNVQDLKDYINTASQLGKIINKTTGESVVEEMRQMLRRIISERTKKRQQPKYPQEEGDELIDPVAAYIEGSAGVARPKVWEDTELRDRRDSKYGEVEISLVFDRSASMDSPSEKKIEQRRAAILVMEALKEWCDTLEEESVNMSDSLQISTEMYSFQGENDNVPIKTMSRDLSEKDRIEVARVLSSTPGGSTPDYVPLEAIDSSINEDTLSNIKDGKLKKIVIVMTDGVSDDTDKVKNILNKMKDKGVIVVAIGITESGNAVLTTYGEGSRVARSASDLPIVLTDLLKEHLADL